MINSKLENIKVNSLLECIKLIPINKDASINKSLNKLKGGIF